MPLVVAFCFWMDAWNRRRCFAPLVAQISSDPNGALTSLGNPIKLDFELNWIYGSATGYDLYEPEDFALF
jgi:hypothetical protein